MTTQPGTNPPGASPFRFFDGQFAANPFPMLAQIRAMGAIVQVPIPSSDSLYKTWMVTRMEEAVQVLKDKRFTVDRAAVFGEPYRQQAANGPGFLGNSMISVDEPDHRRLRGLVSKAFTPKRWLEVAPPGAETHLMLGLRGQSGGDKTGFTGFVLHTDNIEETCATLKARGVNITQELSTEPWGKWAQFTDPDGNEYGIWGPAW